MKPESYPRYASVSYEFKVGMAYGIITHLARGAEIAPLEWNFKSSPG